MTPTVRSQPTSRKLNRPSLTPHDVHPASNIRARLRAELTRQRLALLTDWNLSLEVPNEQAHYADQVDQASNDLALDLAIRVKMRAIAKLKRIEHALLLLRTKHYGCCRRCRQTIPYERLAVQPDARYCVPCLARVESRASRN